MSPISGLTAASPRAATANEDIVWLPPLFHKPSVSQQDFAMYDKFHTFQTADKGWPEHPAQDAATYAESFVYHPFPVEEWCYYVGRRLVGVGYVDPLPGPPQPIEEDGDEGRQPLPMVDANTNVGGLSAIYFFYDPEGPQPLAGHLERACLIAEPLVADCATCTSATTSPAAARWNTRRTSSRTSDAATTAFGTISGTTDPIERG